MKKLIVAIAICATTTNVFAGSLPRTGQQLQKQFAAAIESGKADSLLQMMAPELKEQIDGPVMQRLVDRIGSSLGKVESIEQKFVRSVDEAGSHVINTTADVTFEKGVAVVALKSVDGIVVAFDMESKQLVGWLDRPSGNQLYELRATDFVRTLLIGNTEKAFQAMHPALQKQLGKDDFMAIATAARDTIDATKPLVISVKNSRMIETTGDSSPTMLIDLHLQNGEIDGNCEIKIQFAGLRGHLLGFKFN